MILTYFPDSRTKINQDYWQLIDLYNHEFHYVSKYDPKNYFVISAKNSRVYYIWINEKLFNFLMLKYTFRPYDITFSVYVKQELYLKMLIEYLNDMENISNMAEIDSHFCEPYKP
jgi:hypothetical protein